MWIAMIVVFEEYIQRKESPRDDYKFEYIYNKAVYRFNLTKRDKSKFNHSLQEIHPKDPCAFYEENPNKKGKYKSALKRILNNASWLIQVPKANDSLQEVYNEVKLC